MRISFSPSRSIKTRITLYTLSIFLISIWSLSFYVSRMVREDMQRSIGAQQFLTVSYVGMSVDYALKLRLASLESLAQLAAPIISQSPGKLQTLLEQRLMPSMLFNGGVIVMNPNGAVIADSMVKAGRMGENYLHLRHIASALKDGTATVGEPVMGKRLNSPVIGLAVPVRDAQGKVIGVISGAIDLGKPNFLDGLTQNLYGQTGGYLMLVATPSRLVVTASEKRRVMEVLPAPGQIPQLDRLIQGVEDSAIFVNPQGVEVLTSAKGIASAAWNVTVAIPTAEAFAPIGVMQQRMTMVTLLLTLLAGGLTWWLLNRELSPLHLAARKLKVQGSEHQRLPVVRDDEIGQLVGGFNRLLETVESKNVDLQEKEFRWKFAIEGMQIGVWDWNLETDDSRYSKLWKEMLGYNEADVMSTIQDWFQRVHPDDRLYVDEAKKTYLDGRASAYAVEFRMRCKDESYKWISSRGIVVSRSSAGQPLRMIGTHMDISNRKTSEDNLRRSNDSLRNVLETTLDGFWILDDQGYILDVNPAYCQQSGYSREELIQMEAFDLKVDESAAQISACIEELTKNGRIQFTTLHRRKDGSVWHVEVSATRSTAGEARIFAFFRDVSDARRAQEMLRNSELRLRTIIHNEPECIKIVDASGRLKQMNPAGLAMIEAESMEQVFDLDIIELVAPQYRADFVNLHQRVLSGEAMQLQFEVLGLKGRRRWMDTHAVPMLDHGAMVHLAVTRDITHQKLAEEQLRIAAIAFESQQGMMITNPSGVIVRVNTAFTTTTGYSPEEAIGQTPRLLQSGRHDRDFYRAMWVSILRTGGWQGEIWDRRKNGEDYPVWLTISCVKDSNGVVTHYVGAHHEISERKNAEVAMLKLNTDLRDSRQQLRSMAAQGEVSREEEKKRIAREVHDELGQVLTALRMDMSALGMRFGSPAPGLIGEIQGMKALVDRAIFGVRNVATNLRPTALDMGLIPALEWLCNDFSERTAIACIFDATEEPIELDEGRAIVIFRIVQESLTNITRHAQASVVNIALGYNGDELGLEVRDNGLGFAPGAPNKAKSYGLLGMSERAIALGGHLDIVSAPGMGTVIGVSIPIAFHAQKEHS